MPELPEVESIVRSLDKKISGKKIYRISVLRKNIWYFLKSRRFRCLHSFAKKNFFIVHFLIKIFFCPPRIQSI